MDNIPIEVLTCVFEYLSYSDLTTARLVNKKFYEASLAKKFIRNETLTVQRTVIDTDSSGSFLSLKHSNRRFMKLIFQDVDFHTESDIWSNHGEYITHLSFINCEITGFVFTRILESCVNLKSLKISNCKNFFMAGNIITKNSNVNRSGLPNLREITLDNISFLSDNILHTFITLCPRLASFTVSNCQIICHSGLYRRFYPTHENPGDIVLYITPADSIVTFLYISDFIHVRRTLIKELNFSNTFIDSDRLKLILHIEGLILDTLILSKCTQLKPAALTLLDLHQPNLRCLNLSLTSIICDETMSSIYSLRELRILDISHCPNYSQISNGSQIKQLQKLEELDISNVSESHADGIKESFISEKMKIRKLVASSVHSHEFVLAAARNLKYLVHFDISYNQKVTNKTLEVVFGNLIALRVLNLSGCTGITDEGIVGIKKTDVENCYKPTMQKHLISLRSRAEEKLVNEISRQECLRQLDESIEFVPSKYNINRLKYLRSLDLSNCVNITDISIKYSDRFHDLEVLKLASCQQISYYGIKCLVNVCPGLIELDLSKCTNITDSCVEEICLNLRRLRCLRLLLCRQLSNESVFSIKEHAAAIHVLDLRNCTGIADRLIEELSSLPHIKSVDGDVDYF